MLSGAGSKRPWNRRPTAAAEDVTTGGSADGFLSRITSNWREYSSQEFATQLTLEDSELFYRIGRSEYQSLGWTGKEKHKKAPSIVAFTQHFNHIVTLVIHGVLEGEDAKERAEVISYFLVVAKDLVQLGNINGAQAVVAGLQSAPVYRLKRSWALLGRGDHEIYERLKLLLSEENNWQSLRAFTAVQEPPGVPHIGIFLTDLVYVTTVHAHKDEPPPPTESPRRHSASVPQSSYNGSNPLGQRQGKTVARKMSRSLDAVGNSEPNLLVSSYGSEENKPIGHQRAQSIDNRRDDVTTEPSNAVGEQPVPADGFVLSSFLSGQVFNLLEAKINTHLDALSGLSTSVIPGSNSAEQPLSAGTDEENELGKTEKTVVSFQENEEDGDGQARPWRRKSSSSLASKPENRLISVASRSSMRLYGMVGDDSESEDEDLTTVARDITASAPNPKNDYYEFRPKNQRPHLPSGQDGIAEFLALFTTTGMANRKMTTAEQIDWIVDQLLWFHESKYTGLQSILQLHLCLSTSTELNHENREIFDKQAYDRSLVLEPRDANTNKAPHPTENWKTKGKSKALPFRKAEKSDGKMQVPQPTLATLSMEDLSVENQRRIKSITPVTPVMGRARTSVAKSTPMPQETQTDADESEPEVSLSMRRSLSSCNLHDLERVAERPVGRLPREQPIATNIPPGGGLVNKNPTLSRLHQRHAREQELEKSTHPSNDSLHQTGSLGRHQSLDQSDTDEVTNGNARSAPLGLPASFNGVGTNNTLSLKKGRSFASMSTALRQSVRKSRKGSESQYMENGLGLAGRPSETPQQPAKMEDRLKMWRLGLLQDRVNSHVDLTTAAGGSGSGGIGGYGEDSGGAEPPPATPDEVAISRRFSDQSVPIQPDPERLSFRRRQSLPHNSPISDQMPSRQARTNQKDVSLATSSERTNQNQNQNRLATLSDVRSTLGLGDPRTLNTHRLSWGVDKKFALPKSLAGSSESSFNDIGANKVTDSPSDQWPTEPQNPGNRNLNTGSLGGSSDNASVTSSRGSGAHGVSNSSGNPNTESRNGNIGQPLRQKDSLGSVGTVTSMNSNTSSDPGRFDPNKPVRKDSRGSVATGDSTDSTRELHSSDREISRFSAAGAGVEEGRHVPGQNPREDGGQFEHEDFLSHDALGSASLEQQRLDIEMQMLSLQQEQLALQHQILQQYDSLPPELRWSLLAQLQAACQKSSVLLQQDGVETAPFHPAFDQSFLQHQQLLSQQQQFYQQQMQHATQHQQQQQQQQQTTPGAAVKRSRRFSVKTLMGEVKRTVLGDGGTGEGSAVRRHSADEITEFHRARSQSDPMRFASQQELYQVAPGYMGQQSSYGTLPNLGFPHPSIGIGGAPPPPPPPPTTKRRTSMIGMIKKALGGSKSHKPPHQPSPYTIDDAHLQASYPMANPLAVYPGLANQKVTRTTSLPAEFDWVQFRAVGGPDRAHDFGAMNVGPIGYAPMNTGGYGPFLSEPMPTEANRVGRTRRADSEPAAPPQNPQDFGIGGFNKAWHATATGQSPTTPPTPTTTTTTTTIVNLPPSVRKTMSAGHASDGTEGESMADNGHSLDQNGDQWDQHDRRRSIGRQSKGAPKRPSPLSHEILSASSESAKNRSPTNDIAGTSRDHVHTHQSNAATRKSSGGIGGKSTASTRRLSAPTPKTVPTITLTTPSVVMFDPTRPIGSLSIVSPSQLGKSAAANTGCTENTGTSESEIVKDAAETKETGGQSSGSSAPPDQSNRRKPKSKWDMIRGSVAAGQESAGTQTATVGGGEIIGEKEKKNGGEGVEGSGNTEKRKEGVEGDRKKKETDSGSKGRERRGDQKEKGRTQEGGDDGSKEKGGKMKKAGGDVKKSEEKDDRKPEGSSGVAKSARRAARKTSGGGDGTKTEEMRKESVGKEENANVKSGEGKAREREKVKASTGENRGERMEKGEGSAEGGKRKERPRGDTDGKTNRKKMETGAERAGREERKEGKRDTEDRGGERGDTGSLETGKGRKVKRSSTDGVKTVEKRGRAVPEQKVSDGVVSQTKGEADSNENTLGSSSSATESRTGTITSGASKTRDRQNSNRVNEAISGSEPIRKPIPLPRQQRDNKNAQQSVIGIHVESHEKLNQSHPPINRPDSDHTSSGDDFARTPAIRPISRSALANQEPVFLAGEYTTNQLNRSERAHRDPQEALRAAAKLVEEARKLRAWRTLGTTGSVGLDTTNGGQPPESAPNQIHAIGPIGSDLANDTQPSESAPAPAMAVASDQIHAIGSMGSDSTNEKQPSESTRPHPVVSQSRAAAVIERSTRLLSRTQSAVVSAANGSQLGNRSSVGLASGARNSGGVVGGGGGVSRPKALREMMGIVRKPTVGSVETQSRPNTPSSPDHASAREQTGLGQERRIGSERSLQELATPSPPTHSHTEPSESTMGAIPRNCRGGENSNPVGIADNRPTVAPPGPHNPGNSESAHNPGAPYSNSRPVPPNSSASKPLSSSPMNSPQTPRNPAARARTVSESRFAPQSSPSVKTTSSNHAEDMTQHGHSVTDSVPVAHDLYRTNRMRTFLANKGKPVPIGSDATDSGASSTDQRNQISSSEVVKSRRDFARLGRADSLDEPQLPNRMTQSDEAIAVYSGMGRDERLKVIQASRSSVVSNDETDISGRTARGAPETNPRRLLGDSASVSGSFELGRRNIINSPGGPSPNFNGSFTWLPIAQSLRNRVLKEGLVNKKMEITQGKKTLFGQWKRRWCVLDTENLSFYPLKGVVSDNRSSMKKSSQPLLQLNVRGMAVHLPSTTQKTPMLEVYTVGHSMLKIQFTNQQELLSWHKQLSLAIQQAGGGGNAFNTVLRRINTR